MLQNTTSKLIIGGGRWSVDQTIKSIAGPKSIGFIYRYLLCISNKTLVAYQVTKWTFPMKGCHKMKFIAGNIL